MATAGGRYASYWNAFLLHTNVYIFLYCRFLHYLLLLIFSHPFFLQVPYPQYQTRRNVLKCCLPYWAVALQNWKKTEYFLTPTFGVTFFRRWSNIFSPVAIIVWYHILLSFPWTQLTESTFTFILLTRKEMVNMKHKKTRDLIFIIANECGDIIHGWAPL